MDATIPDPVHTLPIPAIELVSPINDHLEIQNLEKITSFRRMFFVIS